MLNKAQLIGRTGRDPETRYLPSGDAVTSFTLATSKKWKDKQTGEAMEKTEWHRISMFGRLAEVASKYIKTGSLIYIEGEIETRKFVDKNGVEKSSTEIRASEMKLLGNKGESSGEAPAPQRQQRQEAHPQGSGFDDLDSDIPF